MGIDFIALCERHRVDFRTTGPHTRKGWVQVECPACGKGTGKHHLGYCIAYPRFNCWKCGKKPLRQTLSQIFKLSIQQSNEIAHHLPKYVTTPQPDYTGVYRPPSHIKPMRKAHRNYLRKRDFNPDTIETLWEVKGFDMSSTKFPWRLFIPISYLGHDCSWTTRSISENSEMRYISAKPEEEKLQHKHLLYGEDFAGHTIIVVEGPTDVWRIGPGAVGLFGQQPTIQQIVRIGKYPKRYICFDHGAESRAQHLCEQLSHYPGETFNIVLDAPDPGSMGKKELRLIRKLLEE